MSRRALPQLCPRDIRYLKVSNSYTEITSTTSGISSLIMRSIPALRVMVAMGQVPQAPFSLTSITLSSRMLIKSTSPPSACMAGRILSNIVSTWVLSITGSPLVRSDVDAQGLAVWLDQIEHVTIDGS